MSQEPQGPPLEEIQAQTLVLRLLDSLNPKLPITATVTFKVNQALEGAFKKSADALTKATRKLAGSNVFVCHRQESIQQGPESAGVVEYLIHQEWESVELFRAQFLSEHLKQFMRAVFAQ